MIQAETDDSNIHFTVEIPQGSYLPRIFLSVPLLLSVCPIYKYISIVKNIQCTS